VHGAPPTFALSFGAAAAVSARIVRVRSFVIVPAFLLLVIAVRADIGIGDKRDDVLKTLGKPTSIARRGDHEIFQYPKGGRIEFVDGKVADVKGPLPPPLEPVAPTAGAAAPVAKAEPEPTPVTPIAPAAIETKKSSAPPPPNDAFNPAAASNELAKHVEKMDTAWGEAPPPPPSSTKSLLSFFTGLVLRFGITLLALKLAFKYWEMDAFWKGILIIAAIDLALHAGFELLGPATGGLTTMAAVENGVPGFVLIYTINRFCFNKRLQNAVATAAAVKVVVTLCYIFAGVALLNLLYT
jgi:hypothetical protein